MTAQQGLANLDRKRHIFQKSKLITCEMPLSSTPVPHLPIMLGHNANDTEVVLESELPEAIEGVTQKRSRSSMERGKPEAKKNLIWV